MQMSPHIYVALAEARAAEIRRSVPQVRRHVALPEQEPRTARSRGVIRRSLASLGTLREA